MTHQKNNGDLDEPESRLMDSLLTSAIKPKTNDAKIASLLNTLRSSNESEELSPIRSSPQRSRRLLRWTPLPLAAGLLVSILFLTSPANSQNAALAALDRTIQAEQQPSAREYSVTIETRRKLGGTRTTSHQLFIMRNQFAIRTKALLGRGEVWAGGTNEQRWLVPRIGPVLVGGKSLLRRAIPKRVLETPFMSLGRILERTKRFYDLTVQSDVELKIGDRTIDCQHIVGERIRSPRFPIPERVEIWANRDTGFAERLRLQWDDNDSNWKSATAELAETPTLPANFFDHSAHHEPNRRIIRKD